MNDTEWKARTRALAGGAVESGYRATGFIKVTTREERSGGKVTRFYMSCTGALVRRNAVLTAAHCFINSEGQPNHLPATFGLGNRDHPDAVFNIKQFHLHPRYVKVADGQPTPLDLYDVAVAILEQPVPENIPIARIGSIDEVLP